MINIIKSTYGDWNVMNASFFSKVFHDFQKWTFLKCPFFKKGVRDLKKSSISSLRP
jgi:hypothetical protein